MAYVCPLNVGTILNSGIASSNQPAIPFPQSRAFPRLTPSVDFWRVRNQPIEISRDLQDSRFSFSILPVHLAAAQRTNYGIPYPPPRLSPLRWFTVEG